MVRNGELRGHLFHVQARLWLRRVNHFPKIVHRPQCIADAGGHSEKTRFSHLGPLGNEPLLSRFPFRAVSRDLFYSQRIGSFLGPCHKRGYDWRACWITQIFIEQSKAMITGANNRASPVKIPFALPTAHRPILNSAFVYSDL
jgi:hypothetical protein